MDMCILIKDHYIMLGHEEILCSQWSNPQPIRKTEGSCIYEKSRSTKTCLQVCLLKTQDVKVLPAEKLICRKSRLYHSLQSINIIGQNLHRIGITAKRRRPHGPWIVRKPLRFPLSVAKASPRLRAPAVISTLRSCPAHVRHDVLDSRNQAATTAETRVQELDISLTCHMKLNLTCLPKPGTFSSMVKNTSHKKKVKNRNRK